MSVPDPRLLTLKLRCAIQWPVDHILGIDVECKPFYGVKHPVASGTS